MVRIVLIDTGINDNYVDDRIVGGCSIISCGDSYKVDEGYSDHIGHGTATADIILKYSKKAEIYIVRIYENDLFINPDKLCFALDHVKKSIKYDIIQISSGLLPYSGKMHEIIKDIVLKDNKLIISAFDNEGGMSYPAAFEEVLGIDINHSYRKKDQYDIVEDNIIDVRGSEAFFRVPWLNDKKNIVNGTSFLTSYFTAWIADNCENNIKKDYVCDRLKQNAINIYPAYPKETEISPSEFVKGINKAITFPFNKEIYCLAAFENILPFKIVHYYDIKHKFLVGKRIKDVLNYTDNESIIENIDTMDWDGDFDTVICGHLSEISSVTKKDYLNEILSLCSKHNKRAYVFDDLGLIDKNHKNNSKIYSPIIPVNRNLNNNFGKLRTCNIPVLCVLGTSSRQGKYTIQLELIREFKKRGIKVDGIATEPTGALFGFSKMYTYGYGSNNNLSDFEMVRVLNDMVYELEKQDNEIIISGGQSGTIAYDIRNESLIPLEQYSYITGINPDGVILCINEIDEMFYVKKTINFIESISCAKVIAIIVSPVRTNEKEKTIDNNIIEQLKKEYGEEKTIHRLENINVKLLTDEIINYYE